MRESFGGAFIINMTLCLIVIYISLMSIAIIYSRAFRVKNEVINIIEQYQYAGEANSLAEEKIVEYLREVRYPANINGVNKKCADEDGVLMNGVCIVSNEYDANSRYYKVITYIHIELPLFNVNVIIPVNGETKTIID